ncbi:glycosyl hydrolase family 95 catalytic domain-containing protein [Pendulispora albinea]|uniref:Glycosyl hydrolase family 95 catalytic domain-containing protein n=1 Tax=Pendulispora albinea TaxID=2741071 RepID=A0ABZ2LZT8_9BACT
MKRLWTRWIMRLMAGSVALAAACDGPTALESSAGSSAPSHVGAFAWSLDDTMSTDAAWSSYLGGLDPVWRSVPTSFYQGPFLGNGALGASVYQTGAAKRISFKLGDTRVRDHQGTGGSLFGNARLPIGELVLNTAGDVSDVDLRLSLWDAELSGTVTTTKGVLSVRAYVHAQRDVLVVSTTVKSGAEKAAWSFVPAQARSPRLDFKPAPDGLKTNPDPVLRTSGDGGTCTQNLAAGGQTVSQWQSAPDGKAQTLLLTVAHSYPESTAAAAASKTLAAARTKGASGLRAEHLGWWHAFYPKSFVSMSDTRFESFYWIQLYKMASATRRDRPVLSTTGPWLEKTPWPGVWWNLNVQLEYWLIDATNHRELDSLTASLDRYRENLVSNLPEDYRGDSVGMARTSQEDLVTATVALPGSSGDPEVGNLIWALHNAWLGYRHTMDDGVLRDLVFPLLRKSVNFYLHFLTKDAAGVYHLPRTFSPEYASTADCNYDLALLRWGASTLLAADARLGLHDPLAPTWQDVLEHLAPPPQDATNGFWIGADVQLTSSHRHYSHLLGFYPLYELDVTTSRANRDALTKSMAHWLGYTGALQGYTFTGSASMYALLREGDKARGQLVTLFDKYVQPNTMYKESGPVIETPLSGAQSMHDMLLQSWGNTVRVFPAVPAAWADVTLHNVRAEGAFVVSAVRRGGKTQFIRIKSLAGEPCRIDPGNLPGPYDVRALPDGRPVPFTTNGDGTLQVVLTRNDDVLLVTRGNTSNWTIAPAGKPTNRFWGLP